MDRPKRRLTWESKPAACGGKLANENFTSRAPEQMVEKERSKLRDFELSLEKIESSLAQLKG